MRRKNNVLWDFIYELYGVQIILYLVLSIFFGFRIAAWISDFFPLEYQTITFFSIIFICTITIGVSLKLLKEIPSFVMG